MSKMRYIEMRGQHFEGLSLDFMRGVGARYYSPYRNLRSDEVMESYYPPLSTVYGAFPGVDVDDIIDTYDGSRTPAATRRKAIAVIKKNLPKFLHSTYWLQTGIHPDAPAFKEHPEFLVKDKAGKLVPDWTPYNCYQANFSPEYRQWFIDQVLKMIDYMGYDFLYLDCAAGFCLADWGSGRVLRSLDHMDFLKELHEALLKEGKFIFINGDPGHLFVDMLYLEFISDWPNMLKWYRNWRDRAEIPMMYKLYQPEGTRLPVLSWQDFRTDKDASHNDRQYTNIVLKLGLNVGGVCRYDYNEELKTEPGKAPGGGNVDYEALHYYEEAYDQATFEISRTTLVDPDLKPAWWRDYETNIEAYALKQGDAHILTVTSHLPGKKDITLSASPGKMGLQKGKRTFLSRYTRRDDKAFVRKAGPPPVGWTRLFTDRKCDSFFIEDEKVRVKFASLEPEFTKLVSITQVPAVIYSVEGQMTQFLLPETLGCKIDGSADENNQSISLDVIADKPLEIAAWWPKAWGMPYVTVDGKEKKSGKLITLGKETFILISLDKGKSVVEIGKRTISP